MARGRDLDVRVSGAERDQAVSLLGEHMSTGRLDLPEYEARCARASAARTVADLGHLFADLPAPHPDTSAAVRPPGRARRAAVGAVDAKGLVVTRASQAVSTSCAALLVLGVPGAVLLTVFEAVWWPLVLVVALVVVGAGVEEALKQRP